VLVDSHCHLDPEVYGGDAAVDAVVARARDAGVTRLIAIGSGYGPSALGRALAVAERHPDVWCAVGLHPHDAKDWSDAVADAMTAAAAHPRVVALGEMGLDFHYDLSPRDTQRAVLRAQAALSVSLGRPLVIHDRDAGDETFDQVGESGAFDGPGALWHCFTGDRDRMRRIVAAGGYVSLPGIVTFKSAVEMQAVAAEVPLERLMIETDSPFLTPVPFRGQRNEPMHVTRVAAAIAAIRGEPVETIAAATSQAAARFFGLPPAPVTA